MPFLQTKGESLVYFFSGHNQEIRKKIMWQKVILLVFVICISTRLCDAQEFGKEVDPHEVRTGEVKGTKDAVKEVKEKADGENEFNFKKCDFFQHSDDPAFQRLCDWALSYNYQQTGIVRTVYNKHTGVAVTVTEDVKRGDEIFNIPLQLMIYSTNPHLSPTTQKILKLFRESMRRPGYVAEDFELTEMALIVMYEKRNVDSFFYPYLSTLQEPWCPAFTTPEKRKDFEYKLFDQYSEYFVADCMNNFRTLMSHPQLELGKTPDMEYEFLWAVSTVLQRSFDWGPDKRREYVMVPILDMVNHKFNIENNYYYSSSPLEKRMPDGTLKTSNTSTGMVWAVDQDLKAGDEITISYTHSSNNVQLLLQYGFVYRGNPYDFVTFQINPPASISDEDASHLVSLGLFHSIGVNCVVPEKLLEAISLVLPKGENNRKDAYLKVKESIEEELKGFKTTLEEDEAALASGELSREDHNIRAYLRETKNLMKNIVTFIDNAVESIENGSGDSIDTKTYISQHDWPSRVIKVNVGEDSEEITTSQRWRTLLTRRN